MLKSSILDWDFPIKKKTIHNLGSPMETPSRPVSPTLVVLHLATMVAHGRQVETPQVCGHFLPASLIGVRCGEKKTSH